MPRGVDNWNVALGTGQYLSTDMTLWLFVEHVALSVPREIMAWEYQLQLQVTGSPLDCG